MKLVDMTVTEYLNVLKSDAPAPGGGSVSALAGAQGAGLIAMVCDLTLMKEKYAESHELCGEVKEEALKLYSALHDGIDKDTEAFNKVAAAYKMPKETEELKAQRSLAIREANLGATIVPFENVNFCFEGLKLAEKLLGHFNENAASDLGVAALNLLSGLKGAWLNVKINLPGVKDEEAKAKFAQAEATVEEAEKLAAKIYENISEQL